MRSSLTPELIRREIIYQMHLAGCGSISNLERGTSVRVATDPIHDRLHINVLVIVGDSTWEHTFIAQREDQLLPLNEFSKKHGFGVIMKDIIGGSR